MIRLKLTGLQNVIDEIQKYGDSETYKNVVQSVADNAKQQAIDWCPKDSGELANSIRTEITDGGYGFTLSAGGTKETMNASGYDYAVYNEFLGSPYYEVGNVGNPLMSTDTQGNLCFRPFLRPALINARNYAVSRGIFGKKGYTADYNL